MLNVMKIRETLTEVDMGRGAEMNRRNAKRRRKLEGNDRMETKNEGSGKEERGNKIRRRKMRIVKDRKKLPK
jgi:hypothetical protein